jgi:hypothetical protein
LGSTLLVLRLSLRTRSDQGISRGGKVFNDLGCCYFDSEAPELEQSILFLEFEYIFGISVALILLLMLGFYVIYPYDKDLKE